MQPFSLDQEDDEQTATEDQLAFWGPHIVAELEQAKHVDEQQTHHEYLTGDEFLARLEMTTLSLTYKDA